MKTGASPSRTFLIWIVIWVVSWAAWESVTLTVHAAVTLAVIFGGGGDSTVTIEIGESLAEILRDR